MITEYHLSKQPVPLAYQATALQMMLREANYFAERLKLPTPQPIQVTDLQYHHVNGAWYSIIHQTTYPYWWPVTIFSNHIFDSSLPREQRVRSLKIGANGGFETATFEFGFTDGKLDYVGRLSQHDAEYLTVDKLETLIGQPSLINTNQAYQLAVQWLSAVDMDVSALEKKYPHEVNCFRVLPKDSTNVVTLPVYFVHWGLRFPGKSSDAVVEIEILGTTKELMKLRLASGSIGNTALSFSKRPPLLITNAIDLLRTPNLSLKRLQMDSSQTNSVSDTNAPVKRLGF